ncbi:sugar phosphate isomerase/epimerase family protein [Tuwongella immobilis]|uniref:Xylose isomerase-like TIM barrel domain-containing protein n=1 Tax=Tuwongella immobilis TaxID=692036 RepID=A0A6C2YVA6_9BACT|nr:sugar phosphate isomerase/epimerase family protein [Tuwongella immobilis]VIP05678.1 Sugar phosphate isomerase/epimerase OS=Singulisphaera acidiphila (strain ATCC BAA-1392 / DSM 18658 / VKM B-2454 / MOB10) GN=Sinac_2839 PE=4 SV=1: AP_endonuc_2 [Tuwongella immobilis]VTS08712.1 Sugar phosphate isomerase/epimerase OS=Singulisphaera acidiphila (strain ATCC BAA-1392 / DSM 18658 / VKM B-2454 / MOB10) GN=Sinac_2839 PE=4 SV=1: AP_endonuc_2 [Tuwongella immobilis]
MATNRRNWMKETALLAGAPLLWASGAHSATAAADPNATATATASSERADSGKSPFQYCLNTSAIRGQKLGIVAEIELAAKAGYQAIEPWINELDQFVASGGSLKDLRKRLMDAGLVLADAIGFAQWIVDDAGLRAKGMDEAKRCMDLVQQLGGTRLAAPPAGATDKADLSLMAAADRYFALAELGRSMGVTPLVEVWGFSKSLSRLGETVLVAMESRHPQAAVLPDIYHLFKGGSGFQGLSLLRGEAIGIFHMNDYPDRLDRAVIKDADRVYPGDGIAPLVPVLRTLMQIGYSGMLSLELFNPGYWKQDPMLVAKTGLEKMQAVVAAAMAKS